MEPIPDFQLSMSVDGEIAQIVVTGSLTAAAMDTMRSEGLKFLGDSKAKAVMWTIRASRVYPGMGEAYFRARDVPAGFRVVPTAIVDETRNPEFESFYETTAKNAGLTVRFFPDVVAARAWLKSRIAPS